MQRRVAKCTRAVAMDGEDGANFGYGEVREYWAVTGHEDQMVTSSDATIMDSMA